MGQLHLICSGISAALVAISSVTFAETCDSNMLPLPDQQTNELAMAPDLPFEKECVNAVDAFITVVSDFGKDLGAPIFTRSPTWRKILRLEIIKQNPRRRTGVVCFQRSTDPKVQMTFYDLTTGTCKRYAGFTIYPPGAGPRE